MAGNIRGGENVKLDEWRNLKVGDIVRHIDSNFMRATSCREGKVVIPPQHGDYGEPDGKFRICCDVSVSCNDCCANTKHEYMEITLAQALIFWEVVRKAVKRDE